MRITDVDPLQYDLLFERFLNPERISMPDIDIDFCIRGRGEVIDHVTEFYGRDSVCQIVTFGTMASRAAIKDVGRALNMPFGDVEKIAKLIPPPIRGRNVSISQALETVPELKDGDEERCAGQRARRSRTEARGLFAAYFGPRGRRRHFAKAASRTCACRDLRQGRTDQPISDERSRKGRDAQDGFPRADDADVIADCLKSMKEKLGVEIDWTKIS